jgi:tRNA-specific 2-thiouridylase
LFSKTLIAKAINLIAVEKFDTAVKIRAKIRYNQIEQPAVVEQLDSDTLRIEFEEPQRAITKGQAVVMYDGEIVIGGGTIDS